MAEATESAKNGGWTPERRPWGWADVLMLLAWTAALAVFFRDAVGLRGAFFYFDVTEINYPYRDFFASELRAGRFSRWCPGLYCGMPLFSESQAGYLHPLKYLLYSWLPTWVAFNYDCVLSVWLAGAGTYGWLRRHVGPAGALTGAAVFALSGFTWGHFIHTSMLNALASVPLAFWALECAWDGGRLRGVALGALALACQVFAGHLQDAILTGLALGVYGLYRAATERTRAARWYALATTVGLGLLGVALSAVQWVPSKELIDRSPRAGGLEWGMLTYGSWSPELLPTLLVREAYGTRARDTDWMDGFYPYHEMNTYMGVVGLALAVVGLGGRRDRWAAFWPILAIVGGLLMLGRFTFLMDPVPHIPLLNTGRIPVRYHLWVSVAVAALAGVGVDRLARPGRVRLGPAAWTLVGLAVASLPVLLLVYAPVWTEPNRWTELGHRQRYNWLAEEFAVAAARSLLLALLTFAVAKAARGQVGPRRRGAIASLLPLLAMCDLLLAHRHDAPTVAPSYWTNPPPTVAWLKSRPDLQRIFGTPTFASGEPGYASEPGRLNFPAVRDALAWSLPPVWGLRSTAGETPIIPTRRLLFTDEAVGIERLDIEGLSHLLTNSGGRNTLGDPVRVGQAYIYNNPKALPRARLVGRPAYAVDAAGATRLARALGSSVRERIVVEDPDRPLSPDAQVRGTARIVREVPERVEIATASDGPAYLFLADSYDPGWSATVDGQPAPIHPAQVAFRAVFLPPGDHSVVFRYQPAGWALGLAITAAGALVFLACLAWPRPVASTRPANDPLGWSGGWPWWLVLVAALVVAASSVGLEHGSLVLHSRWSIGLHRFTWGAGIEAMTPRG